MTLMGIGSTLRGRAFLTNCIYGCGSTLIPQDNKGKGVKGVNVICGHHYVGSIYGVARSKARRGYHFQFYIDFTWCMFGLYFGRFVDPLWGQYVVALLSMWFFLPTGSVGFCYVVVTVLVLCSVECFGVKKGLCVGGVLSTFVYTTLVTISTFTFTNYSGTSRTSCRVIVVASNNAIASRSCGRDT